MKTTKIFLPNYGIVGCFRRGGRLIFPKYKTEEPEEEKAQQLPPIPVSHEPEIQKAKAYTQVGYDLPPTPIDRLKTVTTIAGLWIWKEITDSVDDFKRIQDLGVKFTAICLAFGLTTSAMMIVLPRIDTPVQQQGTVK